MNRVKKASNMHNQWRNVLDKNRVALKLAKRYRFILSQMTKQRLDRAARILQIKGRSTMPRQELIEECGLKAALVTLRTGSTVKFE
jgi:hypothetical protein